MPVTDRSVVICHCYLHLGTAEREKIRRGLELDMISMRHSPAGKAESLDD
jgi:hypothetical protein